MDAINRIKKEGLTNSHIMDIAFHLNDVSGSGYYHLVAADLQQAATIVAAFVYNAAMPDE